MEIIEVMNCWFREFFCGFPLPFSEKSSEKCSKNNLQSLDVSA